MSEQTEETGCRVQCSARQEHARHSMGGECYCPGVVAAGSPSGEPIPNGYAYQYHDCIRFNHGQSVNGCDPIKAAPYFYRETVEAYAASVSASLREQLARAGNEIHMLERNLEEASDQLRWARAALAGDAAPPEKGNDDV